VSKVIESPPGIVELYTDKMGVELPDITNHMIEWIIPLRIEGDCALKKLKFIDLLATG